MSQPIYDVVGGLKYVGGPLDIHERVTNEIVYQNSLLKLVNGKVSNWTTGAKPCGVALHYAGAGERVVVNEDPESLYEATDYAVVTYTKIGYYCPLTTENANLHVGKYSSIKTVSAGTDSTPSLSLPVQIVGLANNVTNVAAAYNRKCIVKVNTGEFEPYVDAVV